MQLAVWVSFFGRVHRWKYIVRAVRPGATFRHMFNATQIGFLANFTLPGRVGEPIRALVLTRLESIPFAKSMALVALDRVTDLIGLIAVLLVAAAAFRPRSPVSIPGETFGGAKPFVLEPSLIQAGTLMTIALLTIVVAALVLLYAAQDRFVRWTYRSVALVSETLAGKLRDMLQHFAEGLHIFQSSSDMARSVGASLATWCVFLVVFLCAFKAFDVQGPWYMVFVTQALLALAVSVPGAPGFVGQFHLAIVVALAVLSPDTSASEAKAVAIVTHLGNVVPVAIAGAISLMMEQVGLFALKKEGEQLRAASGGGA